MHNLPYPALIVRSMQISRKFNAGLQAECDAESLRNLSGIHAESIYAISMLDFMQYADFTQV